MRERSLKDNVLNGGGENTNGFFFFFSFFSLEGERKAEGVRCENVLCRLWEGQRGKRRV